MKNIGGIKIIMIAALALIIIAGTGIAMSLSNSGGGTWKYQREISIKENSGTTLTDYQVLIELKGADFPSEAKSDGADVRFTDSNGIELNYWIESWDYSGKNAKIWIKVSSLLANSNTNIIIYYGNLGAISKSDGDKTFDYFDSGDKIETWTTTPVGRGTSETDNSIGNPPPSYQVTSTSESDYGYMFKNIGLTTNRIVEFDIMATGSSPVIDVAILANSKGYGQHLRIETRSDTGIYTSGFSWKDSWIPFQFGAPTSGTKEIANTWYKGKVIISSSQMRGWIGVKEEPIWTIRSSPDNTYFGMEWNGRIDNIKIRKYASPEPTMTFAPHKSSSLSITKSATPYSLRQFQESTIKILIENSGTSEVKAIEIMDSIHPSFDLTGGDFPNPKKFDSIRAGESRELQYTIKSKESGAVTLDPATVTYADSEGNIQEVKSEAVSIKVVPSTDGGSSGSNTGQNSKSASVSLHGEKTDVVMGEDILLRLSAVNLITKPKMHVQVIIIPPSGMSVTSSEFSKSAAGQFTANYQLEPGDGKDIEVRIRSNQVGDFNVNGRIIYYFGDDKEKAEDQTLNLPIKVRKEAAPQQGQIQAPTPAPTTAGFEGIISIIGIFLVSFLRKKW